jgi:hypothetical protein
MDSYICPFCQQVMVNDKISPLSDYVYRCNFCFVNDKYFKYQICFDLNYNLYSTSILLPNYNSDCDMYFLVIVNNEVIIYKFNDLSDVLRINKTDEMKIDLADPINSGLLILNRLLKLRAFS